MFFGPKKDKTCEVRTFARRPRGDGKTGPYGKNKKSEGGGQPSAIWLHTCVVGQRWTGEHGRTEGDENQLVFSPEKPVKVILCFIVIQPGRIVIVLIFIVFFLAFGKISDIFTAQTHLSEMYLSTDVSL